jgi:DNA polymerase III alpha subunit
MQLDKFSNPIFNEADIFDLLYRGNISALSNLIVANTPSLDNFQNNTPTRFIKPITDNDLTISEFDKMSQQQWFMPVEYYTFDIKSFCISKCSSINEQSRVNDELAEFDSRGMMPLLKWLKYFVDTCLENNILWGVGRGSSVASYVLYLLGVHRVNSIKYNLDWHEFLR